MKVILTFQEIHDSGFWKKFCDIKGYSLYCINEGLCLPEDTVELYLSDISDIGLKDYIIHKILDY